MKKIHNPHERASALLPQSLLPSVPLSCCSFNMPGMIPHCEPWHLLCRLPRPRFPPRPAPSPSHCNPSPATGMLLSCPFLLFLQSTSHHRTLNVFYESTVFGVLVAHQKAPEEGRSLSDVSRAPRTTLSSSQTCGMNT